MHVSVTGLAGSSSCGYLPGYARSGGTLIGKRPRSQGPLVHPSPDTGVAPSLRLSGVDYSYGRVEVLHALSGSSEGRVIAVLGENGAGKSTLLRLLSSTEAPTSGWLTCAGWDSRDKAGAREFRTRLGVVPQKLDFSQGYTCEDVLRYVGWLKQIPASSMDASIERALQLFDLTDKRRIKVSVLSGGMRQRLNLAQAMVNRPQTVILDEPTVGLDPMQRAEVRRHLGVVADHATVIVATHLVEDVAAIADAVLMLSSGRIAFFGDLSEFCNAVSVRTTPGERPTGPQLEAAFMLRVQNTATTGSSS